MKESTSLFLGSIAVAMGGLGFYLYKSYYSNDDSYDEYEDDESNDHIENDNYNDNHYTEKENEYDDEIENVDVLDKKRLKKRLKQKREKSKKNGRKNVGTKRRYN
jgi:hypothetical protein